MEKKSRILYIKQFLEKHTDEEHSATLKDILAYLEKEGIKADRRAVSADIDLLTELGVDIVRNTGRQHEYFCGGNRFELPEIKLLIDAVHRDESRMTDMFEILSNHKKQNAGYADQLVALAIERISVNMDSTLTVRMVNGFEATANI